MTDSKTNAAECSKRKPASGQDQNFALCVHDFSSVMVSYMVSVPKLQYPIEDIVYSFQRFGDQSLVSMSTGLWTCPE